MLIHSVHYIKNINPFLFFLLFFLLSCPFFWMGQWNWHPNQCITATFSFYVFLVSIFCNTRWSGQIWPTHPLSHGCFVITWIGKCVQLTAFAILHTREGDNSGRLQSNLKSPFSHFSEPEKRAHHNVKLCWEKKNSKARLSFHTITISLWKTLGWNSTLWTACCLAAFKQNNVWFFFSSSYLSSVFAWNFLVYI